MNADSESAHSTSQKPRTGSEQATGQHIRFSIPTKNDGKAVFDLVKRCPPLDTNSVYCNLLQCHHFAATSVKVESAASAGAGTGLLGFVSGYRPPQQENTLFVWQVAVADQARGMNLGVRMICSILAREENAAVTQVHTTITPDNDASWGLFKKLARNLDCEIDSEVLFSGEEHFGGDHKDEVLVSIGPFSHQQVLSTAD